MSPGVAQLAVRLATCRQTQAGKRSWAAPCSAAKTEEELTEARLELGHKIGEAPYEDGCWRQCGVTTDMTCKPADKLGARVIVFHKSALFHKRALSGWLSDAHMPAIALDVSGDRGFVYDGPTSRQLKSTSLNGPQTFQPIKLNPPET